MGGREILTQEQLRLCHIELDKANRETRQVLTENDDLTRELDRISGEANEKIEAANGRIRTLKQRGQEAEKKFQELQNSSIPQLLEDKEALEAENIQLAEQK